MNYFHRLEHWGDVHHPKYLDVLRIAFGVFLCFSGIEFAKTSESAISLSTGHIPANTLRYMFLSQYIILAHVFGGFLIALGALTRAACIAQIPILVGALFFFDGTRSIMGLALQVIVLGLLIYFSIIGSGPWSFDRAVEKGRIK